jgi:ATPase subunit of ABC transporter with duplicated ATPase domains
MWLEDFIENSESTVVIVSHDRAFLNAVTTDTIHFFEQKLRYYKGNYDTFEKART